MKDYNKLEYPFSEEIHSEKYRGKGETFKESMVRIANTLKDNDEHFLWIKDMLLEQRFLPAGRIQASVGSPKQTTAFNCFVSRTIPDSMEGIADAFKESLLTMQKGGGIGYDFSTLRPKGARIRSLDSSSSGPLSFMDVFNAGCATIMSSGHRRGAQMGVMRVDHPDIEEFISAKQNDFKLRQFNVSVGITDEFMQAVVAGTSFNLRFEGVVYDTVDARSLWDKILRSTWDWAEPGVLFIDRINEMNNLWYCEDIAATNPCGEQPLPPYGACLLGSLNLVKYLVKVNDKYLFNYELFKRDIANVIPMMDNVIDHTIYPLPEQEKEAKNKRRMGIGVTGMANCIEAIGHPYGSPGYISQMDAILVALRDTAYNASVAVAVEKGPFPLFEATSYCESNFIKTLPPYLQEDIRKYGIRNSHLLSIAPTGTISMAAGNVSSSIEPVFAYSYERDIYKADGTQEKDKVEDYGVRVLGIEGKKATGTNCVTVDEHVRVLTTASKYVDSAVSKTCNVGSGVSWEDFKDVYMKAWKGGAKGCTTYREGGSKKPLLTSADDPTMDDSGTCEWINGVRSCE